MLTLVVGACTADSGPPKLEPPLVTTVCREAVCDPISGLCSEAIVRDGTLCVDGNACTKNDRCISGACLSEPVLCDDRNPCTDDACDPERGCVSTDNTAPCDDGNACTRADTCGEGTCSGVEVTCDDGDLCTDDRCDPVVGCAFDPRPGLEAPCAGLGVQCPVGFVCTEDSLCVSCDGRQHFVPSGRFWMGCDDVSDPTCPPDEKPVHRVVTDAYVIQPTEVTAEAYAACVEAGACREPRPTEPAYATYGIEGREQHPVTAVTWFDASDYCGWLGSDEGQPWRLCTEAEWEKAARGACVQYCERADDDECCRLAMPTFPWGGEAATCERAVMDEGDVGNNGCGTGVTGPVASKPEGLSKFGLYDMAGNVWEWVADCWHPDFEDAPTNGSAWLEDRCVGDMRVIRGGSFGLGAFDLRATSRTYYRADEAYDFFGFRCCRSIE
jgi:formylglycine-generating enzyme required for sulfatase activity